MVKVLISLFFTSIMYRFKKLKNVKL